eukprot:751275-Hanusia_phi.AAC.2
MPRGEQEVPFFLSRLTSMPSNKTDCRLTHLRAGQHPPLATRPRPREQGHRIEDDLNGADLADGAAGVVGRVVDHNSAAYLDR